jgi:hypothetical protein
MNRDLTYDGVNYAKLESEPWLDLFRLLFFLMCVPLVAGIMFLSLLIIGFAMLGMYVKDLFKKLGE